MRNNLSSMLLIVFTLNFTLCYAQVGIGTTTPKAFLNVPEGRTVLFGADTLQDGSCLIWYGSKGALRAGRAGDNVWINQNIGKYSFAAGDKTEAKGEASIALGAGCLAIGDRAVAIGNYNSANQIGAVALGYQTTASGIGALSSGNLTEASGMFSTAMGTQASTNNKMGSFVIGDYPVSFYNRLESTADNQMMLRFTGGYVLYTGILTNGTLVGTQLAPNGNAWQTLSDSTRKENFRAADGASFLHKISTMRLGSWNYKGLDAKQYRHYGPMAQDFFAAFGHDELGTIGEDKSINQADFDGVNLIAIQALIKEVNQLRADLSAAREKEKTTQARLDKIEAMLKASSAQVSASLKP